jgi:hypothetical protein
MSPIMAAVINWRRLHIEIMSKPISCRRIEPGAFGTVPPGSGLLIRETTRFTAETTGKIRARWL